MWRFRRVSWNGLWDNWMDRRRLPVLAWIGNDGRRLNELVCVDVDGVATANLVNLHAQAGGALR